MRVLLLGGTGEAAALAAALAAEPGTDAMLSLSGATAHPRPSPLFTRSGGFGGAEGLREFLRAEAIGAVIDATHPFAATISRNAARAAASAGVKLLRLDRPAWEPVPGDRWIDAADAGAAAELLGAAPHRVFLAIGRRDLAPFRDRAAHHAFLVRSIELPDPGLLPPSSEILLDRGPFAEDGERRLLRERAIDLVVAKNSGGAAAAKLVAARALGIPVVMIRRPPPPDPAPPAVPDCSAALDWLRAARHSASTRRGV